MDQLTRLWLLVMDLLRCKASRWNMYIVSSRTSCGECKSTVVGPRFLESVAHGLQFTREGLEAADESNLSECRMPPGAHLSGRPDNGERSQGRDEEG